MKRFPALSVLFGLGLLGLGAFLVQRWGSAAAQAGPADAGARVVPAGGGFPARVVLPDGSQLELPAPPCRILPGNAATFDLLSALVEPERLVAVPEAAVDYSRLDRLDARWHELPRFRGYGAEVVLALEPDLVLVHTWQSPETTALLRADGLAVLVSPLPRRWQEILDGLLFLGRVLGVETRARDTVLALEARRAVLAGAPLRARGLRALSYSNLGAGGTAAGSGTTTDVLFELAGLRNAAAEAGLRGHASIDHERLLAIDPDVIVVGMIAEQAGESPSAAHLHEHSELASLAAVAQGRIIALPPRLFTTASQELLDAAERLAREVEALYRR